MSPPQANSVRKTVKSSRRKQVARWHSKIFKARSAAPFLANKHGTRFEEGKRVARIDGLPT